MANIVRLFRAVVKPGKEEEFKSFFVDDAVRIVRKHDGLVSVQVGLPRKDTPQRFLMITTWKSVEALAEFSGPDWRTAVIDPREEDLLAEVSVEHYYDASV